MPTISDEDLKNINKQLEHLTKEVELIKYTLIGNNEFKAVGVVQKIHEHEQYIAKDKTWKNRVWGAAVVVGLIWQPIYETLKDMFLTKH